MIRHHGRVSRIGQSGPAIIDVDRVCGQRWHETASFRDGRAHFTAFMSAMSDSSHALTAPDAASVPSGSGHLDDRHWRRRGSGYAGMIIVALAVLSGLATYTVLTGLTPVEPTREVIFGLLGINSLIVSGMALLIGWQVFGLLRARKQRIAGAVLHTRIVSLFSLFAVIPALIVAIFASVTLNRGLDAWFSERTQSIVDRSITVAKAYIDEQGDVARVDIAAIANNIEKQNDLFKKDRQEFIRRLATLAAFRSLAGAFVVDRGQRRVEASVTANSRVKFRAPRQEDFTKAAEGKLVVVGPGDGNVIRALVKLKTFSDHYLYVYRLVNPLVVEQLAKARAEKAEYERLRDDRFGVQITFALMYAGGAFMFLLAAIWLGFGFADRLVEPVVGLVEAARQVSTGKLDVKVTAREGTGDLATLGYTFNQMTDQLKSQRDELVDANDKLDERRRFTEAVLSGVSAGVIGLDADCSVTLANRSATKLLDVKQDALIGQPFEKALPEMVPVFNKAIAKTSGTAEAHVNKRVGSQERSFIVQVTTERAGEDQQGFVVTFDDITELVSAQRNSAWADIARRIAHEIKNPLTPIQLSAERLQRKYRNEIESDPKVFQQCTDTIIRQVGDIGKMVDEFSSFARMPSALLEDSDLGAIVKEALVLQRVSAEGVDISYEVPEEPVHCHVDRRLVTQALTNLVKNAQEAVEARQQKEPEPPGRVLVRLVPEEGRFVLDVVDNGIGLPKENRNRLTEPYMTTREKGTGLGLAIVKRIMEEHGGSIQLHDAPRSFGDGYGARMRLVFPRGAPDDDPADNSTNQG